MSKSALGTLRLWQGFCHGALPSRFYNKGMAMAAAARAEKPEGDISDAFASLEGGVEVPLEPRFAELKKRLLAGREDALTTSWNRLLDHLREQVALIKEKGTSLIPEISYSDIKSGRVDKSFEQAYKRYGVCVIRGVISEQEAIEYKSSVLDYVRRNPRTKAFPKHDPQVYELYWSPTQIRARSHPNMLDAQRFLMRFWHAKKDAEISLRHPVAYADRLRVRRPGDSSFALGPHMDGGSLERWEETGYRLAGTYDMIIEGNWEAYDPWDANRRLGAVMDSYGGVGNCSAFRMQQAWLSMSYIKGGEGHLKVNPMLKAAMSYLLLRPFFEPIRNSNEVGDEGFLEKDNWRLEQDTTSLIQGASPGHGQSLHDKLHPHLQLPSTMVHMPPVAPGDYVSWHCDTIHAVDGVHDGAQDSSVLYIPVCPLTKDNAKYLAMQRECFLPGKPSPDFGGGEGESRHVGRPAVGDLEKWGGKEGLRSMGFEKWNIEEYNLSEGEKKVMEEANVILNS